MPLLAKPQDEQFYAKTVNILLTSCNNINTLINTQSELVHGTQIYSCFICEKQL